MLKFKNRFFAIVLLLAPFVGQSQICYKTVNDCMYKKKDGFVFNGQSQSGAFIQGDTAEVTIVVYKNMEYRISACCPQSEELDGKLQFQVVENVKKPEWKVFEIKETITLVDSAGLDTGETKTITKEIKKRVYTKQAIMRYNGYKEEGKSEFLMISDKTRKLTIQVLVPIVGGEGGELEADQLACVGLLIEHRPAPKNIGKFGR